MAPSTGGNTLPILALVGAEILSLAAFVAACELRASDVALCESRWAMALPAIALAGQSAATYFMDNGRGGGATGSGTGTSTGSPAPHRPHHPLPGRNRLGQFVRRQEESDALDA
jgi:hypothetical protein